MVSPLVRCASRRAAAPSAAGPASERSRRPDSGRNGNDATRRAAPNNSTESSTHPADQTDAAPITPNRSVSIHAATR
jgi:hypothetical protein